MTTTQITGRQIKTPLKIPGTGANYTNFATDGYITFFGDATGTLIMRPQLYAGRASAGVPTFITYNTFGGYSMPVWTTPANQYEELYFREYIPRRWDGASNITAIMTVCLASAETAGEDFRMQLSWTNNIGSGVLGAAALEDLETQQELQGGRAGQYDVYRLSFAIDYTVPAPDLAAADHFGGRIRRVDATGDGVDEVDGEIILLDFVMRYETDKIYSQNV